MNPDEKGTIQTKEEPDQQAFITESQKTNELNKPVPASDDLKKVLEPEVLDI